MENIQLERQYLHKSHSQYPNYQNRQVLSDTLHFFLFTGSPKGDWCVSTFYARMRTKTSAKKREHISRTSSYIDKSIHYRNSFTERKSIMKKEVITVFTAKKARKLLKEGYQIVDIKPDRLDPDHKRTLFLFKNENGLMEKIIE